MSIKQIIQFNFNKALKRIDNNIVITSNLIKGFIKETIQIYK